MSRKPYPKTLRQPTAAKGSSSLARREAAPPSLFEQVLRGRLSVPRKHRNQKAFFKFLRRAVADREFVRTVEGFRDHLLRSCLRERSKGETEAEKQKARGIVVAVCGAHGGEGASLVSLLLTLSLGVSPHWRIGFVDGRFNRERFDALTHALSLSKNACAIENGSRLLEGHYNESHPNIYFLDSPGSSESLDFFSDGGLEGCLDRLRETFDFTVIDMPPLLEESSNNFLAPLADRFYLVAAAGKTRLADIDRSIKVTEDMGVKISGVVISGQKAPLWSRMFWREYFF